MANITRDEYYLLADIDENKNKFWRIKIYDDGGYTTENGRVGAKSPVRPMKYDGKEESLIRSKTRKGYVLQEVEGIVGEAGASTTTATAVSTNSLEALAVKQIESDSPETVSLIRWLTKINVHKIEKNTTLKYNDAMGVFKTPIGTIVSQTTIDRARPVLDKITTYVNKGNFNSAKLKTLLNEYLVLIPQKVPTKLSTRLYQDQEDIDKQFDILDSLEASLSSWNAPSTDTKKPKNKKEEQVFATKLRLLKKDNPADRAEFKRIEKLYMSTNKSYHQSSRLRLKRVFAMEIASVKEAFETRGRKVGGRIRELWHGTSASNLLSILKGGLIIPKSSDGHVTGRMFGDGIYGSDQSTKSLNYADGYWGGRSSSGSRYMMLMDMAMGKEFVPSGSFTRGYGNSGSWSGKTCPKGYDSTFAKPSHSGVVNNEMIVYKLEQVNLKYLCEFA